MILKRCTSILPHDSEYFILCVKLDKQLCPLEISRNTALKLQLLKKQIQLIKRLLLSKIPSTEQRQTDFQLEEFFLLAYKASANILIPEIGNLVSLVSLL